MHRRVDGGGLRLGHPIEQGDRVVDAERGIRDDVVIGHTRRQRLQQAHGVVDDVLAARLGTVHEPFRELELGVQAGARPHERVRRSAAARNVGGVDVGRGRRCRGEPLEVGRRIAHRQPMPLEYARDVRDGIHVFEEERCCTRSAEHHGGLEAPELLGGDGATPAVQQRGRGGTRRLDPIDESRDVVADLLWSAHREPFGPDDGEGESVKRGESLADRGRGAPPGGQMSGVHTVARKEVNDHRAGVADARLAEELRCAEGQQAPHAGSQCAERPSLGGQLGGGIRVRRGTHDDPAPVVEFGEGGVVPSGRALGQDADADDAHAGQSRRHRRG